MRKLQITVRCPNPDSTTITSLVLLTFLNQKKKQCCTSPDQKYRVMNDGKLETLSKNTINLLKKGRK